MISVQMFKQFNDEKVFEDGLQKPNSEVYDNQWPSDGLVQISNISIRYRKGLPLVVKNLSFEVKPGTKLAIVGRTGSGKSTILLALTRIVEICQGEVGYEEGDGKIEVDGINISDLGLHQLRRGLVIIPQDPFLIEGTLRFNIDPRGELSDADILEIIVKCEININLDTESVNKDYSPLEENNEESKKQQIGHKDQKKAKKANSISISPKILDFFIKAKGENLSLGQRQMICIARALAQRPKILLMDEATASIDEKTDSLIQKIIHEELKDTTVITIAHRLKTVINYDQILVMSDGQKVEEGSPKELTAKTNGHFYSMLKEHGGELMSIANRE